MDQQEINRLHRKARDANGSGLERFQARVKLANAGWPEEEYEEIDYGKSPLKDIVDHLLARAERRQ